MKKDAKKISKALRELRMRAQTRRDFPRKGSKGLARELLKGFKKRRLDASELLCAITSKKENQEKN